MRTVLYRHKFLIIACILFLLTAIGVGHYFYTMMRPLPQVMHNAEILMHALIAHDIKRVKAVSCSDEQAKKIIDQWHLLENRLGRTHKFRFVQARRVLMWGATGKEEGNLQYPVFEVEYKVEFARPISETIVLTFRGGNRGYCAETIAWWRRP